MEFDLPETEPFVVQDPSVSDTNDDTDNTSSTLKENIKEALYDSTIKILKKENETFLSSRLKVATYVSSHINKLEIFNQVLQLKKQYYQRYYDRSQITVIVIGVLIALLSGIQAEINSINNNATRIETTSIYFNILVISLSSSIALISSITKFAGWDSKVATMKSISNSTNHTLICLSKYREEIKMSKTWDELNNLFNNTFVQEQYNLYVNSLSNIKNLLPLNSQVKNLPLFYDLNVEAAKSKKQFDTKMNDLV